MEPKPFTVEAVHETVPVTLTHGQFFRHDLTLSGVGKCQWLSKQAEPPTVGEELIGVIEHPNPDFPPKFKKQKPEQQSFQQNGKDPATQKAIVRQHSQEMALRYAEVQGLRGKLPDTFTLTDLTKIIDWFQKDAAS